MTMSEQVIAALEVIRQQQKPINLADRSVVAANLTLLYQVIKASERLLFEAAQEATGRLKEYLTTHLEEERDHDKWLADDLRSAGIDVDALEPIRIAVELAGSQYYLIKHHNPAALLGYMAALEGIPFDINAVNTLEELHGKDLIRTLRYHAVNDQDHKIELFEVIDELNDPEILRNAVNTQMYLNRFAEELQTIGRT